MPGLLQGFVVRGGRLVAEPGVGVVEAVEARLDGDGPFYVRFEGHGSDLPIDDLQELAGLGEVWADAGVRTAADAMDLAFSGAARIVLWVGDLDAAEMEEALSAMEGAAILACDPTADDLGKAWELAQRHGVGLLLAHSPGPLPEGAVETFVRGAGTGPGLYRLQRVRKARDVPADAAGAA